MVPVPILLAALLAAGCAAGLTEIRRHPQQERLEKLMSRLTPVTSQADLHYWLRVSKADKHNVGLGVLFQRHIYVSEPLAMQADDAMLAAMLSHGLAHHRLHHLGQRSGVLAFQKALFKVSGMLVPGLGYGKYAADPLSEVAMGSWQELAADVKTVEYLQEAGFSREDWARALQLFMDQGYAEQVGRATMRKGDFTQRIAELKK
jgi:predicted Zn-dependent protease